MVPGDVLAPSLPPAIETPVAAAMPPPDHFIGNEPGVISAPIADSALVAPGAKLTDFIDAATLQDIQDSLAAVAQVKASILDPAGTPLTSKTASKRFLSRSAAIADARRQKGDSSLDEPFSAPIVVENIQLGSIVIEPAKPAPVRAAMVNDLAGKLNIPAAQVRSVVEAFAAEGLAQRTASVQFLYLLANALARMCQQEVNLRRRITELSTLFKISQMLTDARGLQQTLDRVTSSVTQALGVKAASLRLLDGARDELVIKSVFNLSEAYLRKGPILVNHSAIDRQALAGDVVYIADMATDSRVAYPEDARREGIASVLSAGMLYKGRPIGVLRVYTAQTKEFSDFQVQLLRSIASQAAVAIENARLQQESIERERLARQVQIAAEVQRRMIPEKAPIIPGFDIAALYVPCFELGGDFYDFIPFEQNSLGIAIGDVVGKGLPASLLMASVRAAIRAYAHDIYDLDEIMARVNRSMALDSRNNEFVTVWYGTLNFSRRQLTYCSAGHDAPLLVRNGQLKELSVGGMVLGVDANERYEKDVVQLEKGDLLFAYTDGVTDAMSFSGEKFGRPRMREALLRHAALPADQICRQILWETRRFVGLNRRSDDTTMVALKVT